MAAEEEEEKRKAKRLPPIFSICYLTSAASARVATSARSDGAWLFGVMKEGGERERGGRGGSRELLQQSKRGEKIMAKKNYDGEKMTTKKNFKMEKKL